ncbi:MAG TPA: metallophosphoesterase family protein [Candidatus Nitrosopolaris sp.]|nr:metallophosphoesterase family protein [Candidatus Nitrosopolaris sp.]
MLEDFKELFVEVKAQALTRVVENATAAIEKERQIGHINCGRVNAQVVELHSLPEELVLIGDIHGDLQSLLWVLKDIDFETRLKNPNNKLIFLGDYVDRGSNSIGVLYVICYLKQKFPHSVILMRGNHEAPLEFPFSSHDLPLKLAQKYGHKMAKSIYGNKIIPLFRLLSLIVSIPRQLLIVHGGLPTGDDLLLNIFRRNVLGSAVRKSDISSTAMEEILWNDPMEHISNGLDWEYSRRGYGKHFGVAISKRWLDTSANKLVIRGHEPCQGFKINHQGMILTLFSCKEAYPGFQAAYIRIASEQLQDLHDGREFVRYIKKIP